MRRPPRVPLAEIAAAMGRVLDPEDDVEQVRDLLAREEFDLALKVAVGARALFGLRWTYDDELACWTCEEAARLADGGRAAEAIALLEAAVEAFGERAELTALLQACGAEPQVHAGGLSPPRGEQLSPDANQRDAGAGASRVSEGASGAGGSALRAAVSAEESGQPDLGGWGTAVVTVVQRAGEALLRLVFPGLQTHEAAFAGVPVAAEGARGSEDQGATQRSSVAGLGPLCMGGYSVSVTCETLRSGWLHWCLTVADSAAGPRPLPVRLEQQGQDVSWGLTSTDELGGLDFTVRPGAGDCMVSVGELGFVLRLEVTREDADPDGR